MQNRHPTRRTVLAATSLALAPALARSRNAASRAGGLAGVSVVHSFDPEGPGDDGAYPRGGLAAGPDGLPWGTASVGGTHNFGVLYRVTSATGIEIMASFGGGSPAIGGDPRGELVLATDGFLYGSTFWGGSESAGTVMRMDGAGGLSVAHACLEAEGYEPVAALLQASDGALYGTTQKGPSYDGYGTAFRLGLDGSFATLHAFAGAHEGSPPARPLTQAADGLLYGVAQFGGRARQGTIYRLSLAGDFELLHTFRGPEGGAPACRLVQAPDGWLYGTAVNGGANGGGTIFRLWPATGRVERVHSFPAWGQPGSSPGAGLVLASDGNFYGVTGLAFASAPGRVYRLSPDGRVQAVASIPAAWGAEAPLYESEPGVLLGTTQTGGAFGSGCVFRVEL